ncbi:MAG: O-acetyl-ADP-ribose deacetylase [Magnetococcales bacterium]|nr:O-acetyl-ADP-ribose deacetylase [Magnetococcales bacterium]
MERVEIIVDDITNLKVDAIVNAANSTLLGGGGVDGAIHSKGGPDILEACKEIRKVVFPQGLPVGMAVITTAGLLPAKYVIHTVGPIYGEDPKPQEHLKNCYENCLKVANQNKVSSIAFPGISTGVYGFPKESAAAIALTTINEFLDDSPGTIKRVVLCAFSKADQETLEQTLSSLS